MRRVIRCELSLCLIDEKLAIRVIAFKSMTHKYKLVDLEEKLSNRLILSLLNCKQSCLNLKPKNVIEDNYEKKSQTH
jgi:hypothetical protein